jgi:NADH-quinone oxidoreductase subunit J
MIIYDLLFYIFAFLLVIGALTTITVKNPVYSVLSLIFSFFNTAGLFVLLGAEFLAMSLIIVYVGAVAVLFLFVVMMLNIKLTVIKDIIIKHRILLLIVALILLIDLGAVVYISVYENKMMLLPSLAIDEFSNVTNTELIGKVLYTNFALFFELSGIILLVAMVGSIVLTYRPTDGFIKKQDISKQLLRTKENGMKIVSVKAGEGVNAIYNK